MTPLLIVGDVGGTKTDLGIYSLAGGPGAPLVRKEFASRRYPTLAAMVRDFLVTADYQVDCGCFAVAGPVIRGRAHITNRSWIVDEVGLAQELGLRSVCLLNDVEAIARAVPALRPEDLHTLNQGDAVPGGAIAVIAPGTGLGEAFLTWNGECYEAHPSEGGHASFAPTTEREIGLLAYLVPRAGHVSVERVCSGRSGVPNLYAYLRDSGDVPESPTIAHALPRAADRSRFIAESALGHPGADPLCAATLELFVSILAAEAANLALKVLATGGLYIAGGIAPQLLPLLAGGRFMEAFMHKGRVAELLSRVPVHVIMQRAALPGAATLGLELMAAEWSPSEQRVQVPTPVPDRGELSRAPGSADMDESDQRDRGLTR
jgi:glucokinase